MTLAVIIVAAGRGSRASGDSAIPKQYRVLAGKAVLARSVEVFRRNCETARIVVVVHSDDVDLATAALAETAGSVVFAFGGATRQESVAAGLRALAADPPDHVLIHDAARPFVSAELVARAIDGLGQHQALLPVLPVADTLKRARDGQVTGTVDRAGLYAAQTPQAFDYSLISKAHRKAVAEGRRDFTDDVALVEWCGAPVHTVEGEAGNIKLTTQSDFELAEARLHRAGGTVTEIRTGTGFDVHEFGDGDAVILCGVRIPHDRSLVGHSDADVGLHALTDALLGAIGDGDIGTHFPPSDPQWKGASSDRFLKHAADLVRQRNGRIVNVDVTLLCEAPKIAPHRPAMCARMADILSIEPSRVSVKATTMEGLGFVGRREGIAAQAIATVTLPADDHAV